MSLEKKFVHVSFRIPSESKAALESESRRRGINVNALASQILAKYASFDRIAERVEAVSLSKVLFVGMLDRIEIEEMERLGRELGPKLVTKTFARHGFGFDLDGLVEHYFRPLSMYSRWYNFDIVGSGSNRKLIFEHSYGPKWSAYLRQSLMGIIRLATENEPQIVVEEDLVTVLC